MTGAQAWSCLRGLYFVNRHHHPEIVSKQNPRACLFPKELVCKQGGILGWHQGDLPSLLWYLSWHADTLEPKPMTRKETRSRREKPSWSLKTLVCDRTNTGLGANVSLLLQGSTLQIPTTATETTGITDQRYRCLSLTGTHASNWKKPSTL